MTFLSNEAISNLKTGKSDGRYYFKVINDSISENLFLEPFWRWVTYNILPEWLAPNLMTFIGFILNQFGYACLLYFYPTPPSWALFTCALCFWLYQTLDGSDGKQARKTDNCSQLGEIFDHGVDALSVTAFTMTTTLLGGKDPSNFPSMIWLWIIIFGSFIICHWEHYHTGVFYLGYAGPCDAQVMIIATLLVSAILNDISIWKVPLSELLGYDHFLLNYSYGDLCMFITCAGGLLSIVQSTYQVFKKTNILIALKDLIPTFIFLSLFYIYSRTSTMWNEHYILVSYFITPIFGNSYFHIFHHPF
jgi:ethanolaminephosphotransferase